MKSPTMRSFCATLIFTFAACILGPYQIAGVSVAVAVLLLAGVALDPLLAAVSAALYVLAGIWLPVYAGGASGTGVLLGNSGGYLFALILCALVVSALRRGLRSYWLLATFVGLCVAFVLYFGVGILWYVVKTGASVSSVFGAQLVRPCILFGLDALLALLASPTLYRAAH